MKRIIRRICCLNRQQTANGMSVSIAAFAVLFLHLESAPTPAGADVARRPSNKYSLQIASVTSEKAPQVQTTEAGASDLTPEQRTEQELAAKIQLLEKGVQFLEKTPDYTATFVKQELVNGDLLDEQEMEMKVRHAPFSVYLKWTTGEVGREVLFVDGANNGKMTAHGGGWKARLPAVSIEPTCGLAMAESRYPVNKAGLFELAKMMLQIHKDDLAQKKISRCEKLVDQVFDGRPCHAYLIEYRDRSVSENYRKSISLIDKEWSIPVYTRNFGWLNDNAPENPEELDTASLLEFYSYSSIKFGFESGGSRLRPHERRLPVQTTIVSNHHRQSTARLHPGEVGPFDIYVRP